MFMPVDFALAAVQDELFVGFLTAVEIRRTAAK
jgi:hypothetical protein